MDGFKSVCSEQCIDVAGLTVLIGPNGSGKTSVLEALDKIGYLSRVLTKNIDVKFNSILGLEEISIDKDTASITYFGDAPPLTLSWDRLGNVEISLQAIGTGLSMDASILRISEEYKDIIVELGSGARSFLHRSPIRARAVFKGLPDIDSEDVFERVCAHILYDILSDDVLRSELSRLLRPLGYDGIGVERRGEFLYLKARDCVLGKWVYLEQAADGLRYVLPFVVSLVTCREPALLLIDDVEIGLHPRAVIEVARFIVDVVRSGRARIVATTHSEVFLYTVVLEVVKGVLPEDKVALYIAYRDDNGCTRYSRFKPSIPLRVEEEAMKALEKMGVIGVFEEASTLLADIIKYYSRRAGER